MAFCITEGKGFQFGFANEWAVSVQFGPGNYADNYSVSFSRTAQIEAGAKGSDTAECACFDAAGNMVVLPEFMFGPDRSPDVVSNRSTPEQVLRLMNWAASQPTA